MKHIAETNNDNKRCREIISRIAAELGCSTEFFLEESLNELDQTSELLKLWLSIDNIQDRAKVLTYARTIAAQIPPSKAA
ncbi:hypothetical protein FV218_11670 [Methylobacterium sp. WL69]|uniref:hypothetical protein n=1 Tax=Methylobacterium sp. WL69 TaxID=2603893 RepID=UPI0011CBA7E0|nr:hypothetical protein [Methylobacterium sp. WL69]TXM73218.1 hypothetical protein FV218_11670 [Methylobacterium sp. WL69]